MASSVTCSLKMMHTGKDLHTPYRTAGAESLHNTLQISSAALRYARTHGAPTTGNGGPRPLPDKAFQSTLRALELLNKKPFDNPTAALPVVAKEVKSTITPALARSSTKTARVLSLLELAKPDGLAMQLANMSSVRVNAALQFSAPLPLPVFTPTSPRRVLGHHSMAPVLREASGSTGGSRTPLPLSVFVSGAGEESLGVRPPTLVSALTDDHFFGAAGNSVGVAGWRRYKAAAAASGVATPHVSFASAGVAAAELPDGGSSGAQSPGPRSTSPAAGALRSPRLSSPARPDRGGAADGAPSPGPESPRRRSRPSTAPGLRGPAAYPLEQQQQRDAPASPQRLEWSGVAEGDALCMEPSKAVSVMLARAQNAPSLRDAIAPALEALAEASRQPRVPISKEGEGSAAAFLGGGSETWLPEVAHANDGAVFFRPPPRQSSREGRSRPSSAAARSQGARRARPRSALGPPRTVRMGRLALSEQQAEAVLTLQVRRGWSVW